MSVVQMLGFVFDRHSKGKGKVWNKENCCSHTNVGIPPEPQIASICKTTSCPFTIGVVAKYNFEINPRNLREYEYEIEKEEIFAINKSLWKKIY